MPPQADLPPPPYTETDIYSTSSDNNLRSPVLSPSNPNPISLPHHHRRQSSASTLDHENIVYTPPETPRSTPADPSLPVPPPASFVSAAGYFDARPAPQGLVAVLAVGGVPRLTHPLTLGDGAPPPAYPAETLAERDVTAEDWLTFGNYLVPPQAPAVDEKKQPQQDGAGRDAAAHVDATVREWNAGFFGPRGVVVVVQREEEQQQQRVPGAWDAAFDGPAAGPSAGPSAAGPSRFAGFGNPFAGPDGAIRFGGITIDGDRVSIGNRFVADRNGVRMGGVVADGNGISVNGQPMFGGPPGPMGGARGPGGPGWGSHCGRGGWGGFGHRGGPFGGWGGRGGWGGASGGGPCGGGFRGRGRGGWPGRGEWEEGRGGGRWRGRGRHGPGGRERSDSVSSASSSSSSSSESSVGSLPAYDDLKDTQLPLAKQYLEEWLHHPDEPITKERVKEAKEQIKQAKKSPADPQGYDFKAVKKQVKELHKEWKALKKEQRRARKELRRERRQKRKDERRERRNVRRDMRRAERDFRRGRGPPVPPGAPGVFPFVSPIPPVPHMGAVPPIPPVPHMGAIPPVPPVGPFGHVFGRWARAGLAGVPVPLHADPVPPMGPDVMSRTPGAWPGQFYGIDGDDAYGASLAKYKVVRDLEAKIANKELELLGVHQAISLDEEEKRNAGGESSRDGKGQTKLETEASTLENEIEALTRSMKQLRTEADEEFAKELAADEERKQGGVRW